MIFLDGQQKIYSTPVPLALSCRLPSGNLAIIVTRLALTTNRKHEHRIDLLDIPVERHVTAGAASDD